MASADSSAPPIYERHLSNNNNPDKKTPKIPNIHISHVTEQTHDKQAKTEAGKNVRISHWKSTANALSATSAFSRPFHSKKDRQDEGPVTEANLPQETLSPTSFIEGAHSVDLNKSFDGYSTGSDALVGSNSGLPRARSASSPTGRRGTDRQNSDGPPGEEDIPMAKVYHQLINLTNKPPSLRTNEELEELVPWLRKKSSHLFQTLEDHKIKKILKNADFRRYRFDDVIIRQGDIGTEFFILVSGSVSFHVNSTDDVETMVGKQKQEEAIAKEQGRPVARDVYGTQVGSGVEGKTFGELALIYADCVRNATVISTSICSDVLVVSKSLYDETLSGHQAKDHIAKEKFVQECPLFYKWSAKYKKMATMSIEKVMLKFEDVIVKQGTPVNGLHFLISGQVKIKVDPSVHPLQFPQHFPSGDIADLEKQKARELLRKEMNLERHKNAGKRSGYERRSVHHDGRRSAQKPIELCLMGAVDTIGDLEMVLNLPSYSQTVVCTEAATVYHLDQRNYDRLVEKKNPQTVDLMKDIVHTKLTLHFSRLHDDSIPMYRYVLYTLDERERDARERRLQQRQQQIARKQLSTTATDTTNYDIDSLQKGPLVNLYGPGSVFYYIRSKAKERKQRQQRQHNMNAGGNNPALRFGQNQAQSSSYGRAPLADSRFFYEDDTSIEDGHIVNIYGYNESNAPQYANGEVDPEYAAGDYVEGEMGYDEYEEEEQDWATSDVALSNLEERIQRWHNSFGSSATRPKKISTASLTASAAAPIGQYNPSGQAASATGEHCVVKLHRFHFDDENRPKPGNKVYVRERQKVKLSVMPVHDDSGSSPEPDMKTLAKYLSASSGNQTAPTIIRSPRSSGKERESDTEVKQNVTFEEEETHRPLLQKRANSASTARSSSFPKPFKKSKQHQYTAEEYQLLKDELRRRQRAYKSFLPNFNRANTVL